MSEANEMTVDVNDDFVFKNGYLAVQKCGEHFKNVTEKNDGDGGI